MSSLNMDTTFEGLVKKLSPTLKRITYKLNGHFSFFNDEDLFQEALLHLWLDFQAGKLDDKTDSYILQGCYFYLKNYLRKTQSKATLISLESFADEGDAALEEILSLDNRGSCFDYLDNKMLVEDIQNNGLTEREKEVFSFCLEGLTVREIGERMGISHVRVVKLRNRIRAKCKNLI